MDIETKIMNISKETLEEISKINNEPEWLLERRKLSFEKFESAPNPTSRRMDYNGLNLDNYFFDMNEDDSGDVEYKSRFASKSLSFDINIGEKNSISNIDNKEAIILLDDEYKSKGVILTTLRNAISEHAELLNKYLFEIQDQQSAGKFNLLNSALWQNGTFIYVPKNVEVSIPLTNLHIISKENNIYLPLALIVTELGSKVTLIDYHASDSSDMNAFVSNSVEIIVGQNAKVDYVSIQEYGTDVNYFASKRAVLKKDATLNWVEVSLGSKFAKNNLTTILGESGSEVAMSGMFLADQDQQMEFNTSQIHVAPHAKSDLLYVGALRGRAHTNYEGIIRVHKGAQKTDAYQKNRNLLLSPEAKADSEPFLEIEANDVRCTHGATVGPIEKEDLFYLMSRGIPKELAVKLLVLGFFSKVTGKIPVESVRAGLESYIQEHAIK